MRPLIFVQVEEDSVKEDLAKEDSAKEDSAKEGSTKDLVESNDLAFVLIVYQTNFRNIVYEIIYFICLSVARHHGYDVS